MRAAAAAFAVLASAAPAAAASDARDVPLVDQNGARFTLRALHRPVAVIFVATRCGDACPLAEGLFAKLAGELAAAHVDAGLLTVTLDPRFDRPFVMAWKAHALRADAMRWRWASGEPADVERLLDAFNVPRLDGRFHGAFAYVLDAHGVPARVVLLSTAADRELLAILRSIPRV
ncbi:MAG TPA: SCO family protein [Candidatus Elarobacter sp.]|nr:SCO family protein [Candidatus Elarobacter sp.]